MSWSEMINVEVFHGRGGASPETLQQQVTDGFKVNCETLHVDGLGRGTTSGLPAGRWITYCGKVKQTGKGEITYFQAISGKANFYLVQRALRVAPFDPAQAALRSRDAGGLAEILRPGGGLRQWRPNETLPVRPGSRLHEAL